jgi:hypothetical protein
MKRPFPFDASGLRTSLSNFFFCDKVGFKPRPLLTLVTVLLLPLV